MLIYNRIKLKKLNKLIKIFKKPHKKRKKWRLNQMRLKINFEFIITFYIKLNR
jgi:hypothetical protein